jgi:hypothetical protein
MCVCLSANAILSNGKIEELDIEAKNIKTGAAISLSASDTFLSVSCLFVWRKRRKKIKIQLFTLFHKQVDSNNKEKIVKMGERRNKK